MRKLLLLLLIAFQMHGQQMPQYKIAIIGLVHAHAWGHLPTIIKGGSFA